MAEAISNQQIFDEIKRLEENMITKKEIDALLETIEILGNKETMEQIEGSDKDIEEGKVKEISSVHDLI